MRPSFWAALALSVSYFCALGATGRFSGRLASINKEAELVKARVDFGNLKYLSVGNRIQMGRPEREGVRCQGVVKGRSPTYLLLALPGLEDCLTQLGLRIGQYVHFQSGDLEQNLEVGQQLVEILLKKRLAIKAMLRESERELATYQERLETVDQRYQLLQQKLQNEWDRDRSALQEDKAISMQNHGSLKQRLDDVERKMEKYKIHDKNFKIDRWALDPQLYIEK